MGLDIYVGTLTRYYRHDWETIVQRVGRETGLKVTMARQHPHPDVVPSPEDARAIILEWRANLGAGLGEAVARSLDWCEDLDAPYFTDKPTWECYSNLLLWAADEEHPEIRKRQNPVNDFHNDPAFQASNLRGAKTRYGHLLRDTEIWLPCPLEEGAKLAFAILMHLTTKAVEHRLPMKLDY